jgi:hypothetical protein
LFVDRWEEKLNRQEAIACGATHYNGKVCEKHPELEGKRFTSCRHCVEWLRVDTNTRRKTPKSRAAIQVRMRKRYLTSEFYRSTNKMRGILRHFVKRIIEGGTPRVPDFLCCFLDQFIRSFEAQFPPGCTWADHGVLWEIDHVAPLHLFDFSKPLHRVMAFHWSNVRPLLIADHKNRPLDGSDVLIWEEAA